MKLPVQHLRHQVPAITTLIKTAWSAPNSQSDSRPDLVGRSISVELPPRPRSLITDYVRAVGGDPQSYKNTIPPHMFCQWGLPLSAQNLKDSGLPLRRGLNGGCRLEIHAPLPANEPLQVTATVEDVNADEFRVVIRQRVTTETASSPSALAANLFVIIPLKKRDGKRDKARVPADAREIAFWRLSKQAGLSFALLTGDINPLHWVPAYARAMGFKSSILHGFATMARAYESVVRAEHAGDVSAIHLFDARFVQPLPIPGAVGVYRRDSEIYVGDAPSGPAYMTGEIR